MQNLDKKLKKIDIAKNFISYANEFICPICSKRLTLTDNHLTCANNHTFDLSKKGMINLLKNNKSTEDDIYNKSLFIARRTFVKALFYEKVYEEVVKAIKSHKCLKPNILDIGCGEGEHDYQIIKLLNNHGTFFGFDIIKSAIEMATDYLDSGLFPFVANLSHIPLEDNSIDIILNFLSPYNYNEINRILKNNGMIIKIIPTNKYLHELRHLYDLPEYEGQADVENNFCNKFKLIDKITVENTYTLDEKSYKNLIKMTPLLSKKLKEEHSSLEQITISLCILIGKKKEI